VDKPTIDVPSLGPMFIPGRVSFDLPVVTPASHDPILIPTKEQMESVLEEDQVEESEESEDNSNSEALGPQVKPPPIRTPLPTPKETVPSEEVLSTFTIPLLGMEMAIPTPEVITTSVVAAGTASLITVAGGMATQTVVNYLKKIFKKIFTKVLKKEVKAFQKTPDSEEHKNQSK
tara:strand:+ start:197 stop:721 length:525 start_codon:yes stop_codon:yes gene_type:complete